MTLIEESVLERIRDKLTHVKDFSISGMWELPAAVRAQFVEFAAEVIEQHQSQFTVLDFNAMSLNCALTPLDTRLVESLCNSGNTQLKTLRLAWNN